MQKMNKSDNPNKNIISVLFIFYCFQLVSIL